MNPVIVNPLSVSSISLWTAFVAGVATFFTPCILPVIPGFIAYFIADREKGILRSIVNVVGFVIGLSFVFVNLGLLSGIFGDIITGHKVWVNVISGAIIMVFGLHIAGMLKIPFVDRMSMNISVRREKGNNFFTSLVMGFVFSLVWSPCISPTLGSILVIASNTANIWKAGYLLAIYSFGMSIPFIISAIMADRIGALIFRIQRYQKAIERAMGILLLIVGILMATGQFNRLGALL